MAAATSRTPAYPQGLAPRPRRSPPWWRPAASASLECVVIGPGPEVDHALRRLSPEAARVRCRRPADPSLRPRRPASHRDPGPAASDVVRPAPSGQAMNEAIPRKRARASGRKVAVVLGSGLGGFADEVEIRSPTIPYGELPGFPATTVGSHAGQLVLGHVGPTPVAVLQGRAHYYERGRADEMKRRHPRHGRARLRDAAADQRRRQPAARHAARLGDGDHRPHQLHRRQSAVRRDRRQPLRRHGRCLRSRLASSCGVAARRQTSLHEGVYIWFSGPSFETPAEIRAARVLGADAVGMSTVPETILARHAGTEGRGLVADDQLRGRH